VIQNGGRLSAAFGAHRWRERSGGQISAQPAPLDSPESGHHPHDPIFLFLIIAAPRGFNIVPFSGCLQYGNATRLQTDDGSDRGHARWLFRRAKVSVGPRRASSTHGLSSTSFWRFGPDKGTSILARQQERLARRRQEWSRSFLRYAPPRPPYLTHARARATHRCGVDSSARVEHEAEGDYEDKVGVSTAAREAEGDDKDDRRLAADVASVS
jgi:hypothetical protein